jgi:hypothetical protein
MADLGQGVQPNHAAGAVIALVLAAVCILVAALWLWP